MSLSSIWWRKGFRLAALHYSSDQKWHLVCFMRATFHWWKKKAQNQQVTMFICHVIQSQPLLMISRSATSPDCHAVTPLSRSDGKWDVTGCETSHLTCEWVSCWNFHSPCVWVSWSQVCTDLMVWTRSHSWPIPGSMTLTQPLRFSFVFLRIHLFLFNCHITSSYLHSCLGFVHTCDFFHC